MQADFCMPFFVTVSGKRAETDIIALEGQSYAGKSTCLAALQRAGYGVIREYAEYKTFASPDHFVPLSPEQAKEDFLLYVDIERQRYQEYLYLRQKQKRTAVFLDRSIFTLIAYRFAIQAPMDILAWAMETVMSGGVSILYPQHILYIDLPLSLVKHRHHHAGDHLPTYFMDEIFYERFRSFFLALQASMPTRMTIIDGSDTAESTLQHIYTVAQARGLLSNV
ncbi:MAG: hypothetical protein H0U76_08705 [Ktedonobacteraceae bacterium]|nr:hypothetical protein [Ktedonobacteraceae bacterium]